MKRKINPRHKLLLTEAERRVLILDGAMGTMIQKCEIHDCRHEGCHDYLSLAAPDVVRGIHRQYLEAGADIITANSFNANAVSLRDYGLQNDAYQIARAAAAIARDEADRMENLTPDKPRFVAGTVGPTNKTASISADILDPAAREVTFSVLRDAYIPQIEGLLDGGADIILIETVFDTLNAKAAIYAVEEIADKRGERIPLMISATISDAGGRTLSGQTLEAFYSSVKHADLFSIGLNCAFGPEHMLPFTARLSRMAECKVSCHPNAGLPNAFGEYDETPVAFAEKVRPMLEEGFVDIIGGCCGTTPEHIREVAKLTAEIPKRRLPVPKNNLTTLSGLEVLAIDNDTPFINIGERTNVAGSAKFARLIREGNYGEALTVALKQIEAGAQIIDVCMDDGMIDGPTAMRTFLNLVASEPEVASVPVMIDSSNMEVIRAGLEVTQGKCIVNSISLKEGEVEFLRKAREIRRFGAAVVVMLFDEDGQATDFDRKIRIAERSYRLLTSDGFPAEDIIFDPNILTIGTGMPEHERYAVDFIRATKWIKENLPGSKVSGGVSNLSFAFRGNNPLREAMHSVFLYHAIEAGLDMALVNAQNLKVYEEIDPKLVTLLEDLILARRGDATESLLEYVSANQLIEGKDTIKEERETSQSLEEKISGQLTRGVETTLEEDLSEALAEYHEPLAVVEKILMPAMDHIGMLFGEGKMFLPQMLKSARVLKKAISILAPALSANDELPTLGTVIIATVRGDIHDIGKNIVSLVVGCNGYEVVDLGVMADAKKIADEAERLKPVAVMLSGLITPSLNEMVEVCRELERRGMNVPVIVGGATTSPMHTALKIATEYSGVVLHAPDAGYNNKILSELTSPRRPLFIEGIKREQQRLRAAYEQSLACKNALTLEEARKIAVKKAVPSMPQRPSGVVRLLTPAIEEVEPFIDWTYFFASWGLKGKWPEILDNPKYGEQARLLYNDAEKMLAKIKDEKILMLQGVSGVFKARGVNEEIIIETEKGDVALPVHRSLNPKRNGECVADWLAPEDDRVMLFALTAGIGLKRFTERLIDEGDEYGAVMAKLLADRLAEAFTEWMQVSEDYRGRRLAVGYPLIPDHELKREIFNIIQVEKLTDIRLTANAMMIPEESVCGLIVDDAI